MKALSLFSSIGVAEAYFEELGINVVVANEFVKRRTDLYKAIYPKTHMICGDITEESVFMQIVSKCIAAKIDVVIATPPCQGLSRAGHQKKNDARNNLVIPVIDIVNVVKPKYVFIENVPELFETTLHYNEEDILIPKLVEKCLSSDYQINTYIVDTKDYSVPQTRERAIILMTRKDIVPAWKLPSKDAITVTLHDAIGELPPLDPFIKDVTNDDLMEMFPEFNERKIAALNISKWHNPPHHIKRQVITMMHTPTGCTAFDNKEYFPQKADGSPISGYKSTYRRLRWHDPASTVTMDNRKISSQNNVHPGRYVGTDSSGDVIYSDPRVLTVFELMKITSLPANWPVPIDTPEAFLRSVIGEGIPPLFVKKVFENIIK